MVAPATATPLARATDIPTVTSIPTIRMVTTIIALTTTPTPTDSAICPGSTVTIGPIGDFGGHPITSFMVITSIVIDRI
jgi:hypothetical protein